MKVAKGKLTVIAHVACNNTKDSEELARPAESLGVEQLRQFLNIFPFARIFNCAVLE